MPYTKVALKRDPNTPIGQRGPMYFDCPCGEEVSVTKEEKPCVCGAVYDSAGWVIIPSAASRTEAASRYTKLGTFTPDAF
jgi:hypothetical protein